jgi:hypothetical protein
VRNSCLIRRVRGSGRPFGRRVLLLTALLAAGPAVADEPGVMISGTSGGPNLLEDKFNVTLGTFILESNSRVRLDGPTGELGTDFDWEQNFGGSDANRFRVDGAWRFADRHKVRAMWFNFSHNRSAVFDEEVDWGDVTFPVDVTVNGSIEFDIYELAYEYAFLKRETLELSGSFGLHLAQFTAGMRAEVDSGGGTGTTEIGDEGDLNAPLPVIGGRVIWRIHRDFWLDAMVQFFALEYENVDGRLIDTRIGVLWQPRSWGGIGIGYNRFDMDVDVTRSKYTGKLDWIYDGPQIFYSVSF